MKLKPIFFLVIISSALAGCVGPEQLGFSKHQWQTMPKAKQQQYLTQYGDIHAQLTQQLKQDQPPASNKDSNYLASQPIVVQITKAKAWLPPSFLKPISIVSVTFTLQPGLCKNIVLTAAHNQQSGKLYSCYRKGQLQLDPSHYDPNHISGTLFIDRNPLWQQGFSYHQLSTKGYTRLEQATIRIASKKYSPHLSVATSQNHKAIAPS